MRDRLAQRIRVSMARLRRIERRELDELRGWIQTTDRIVHLSMLVLVPFLIWLVTTLANTVPTLSFLLFPPLASGSYTLFIDPRGKYSNPGQFVAGLTIGAACGLGSIWLSTAMLQPPTGNVEVSAIAAGVAVLATGVVTWPLDIEEPSAYSTALLTLLVQPAQRLPFLGSIFLASSIVAVVFVVWRRQFYEQRATFLYESTTGDDHVLVPMRGETAGATAMFGARLAAAHEAGKVVLLDIVSDADAADAERSLLDGEDSNLASDGGRPLDPTAGDTPGDVTETNNLRAQVEWLETHARRIETRVGVPTQVAVAVDTGTEAATTIQAAREANCDLIVAPYESRHGALSPYLRRLFGGDRDVVIHRSHTERTRWKRVLVPVRRASDVANHMIDFATRLAGQSGHVAVGTCISDRDDRRRAEEMLVNLVDPFDGDIETRVTRTDVADYLASAGPQFDLVVIGASQDRSAASRFISPPTFERVENVETDVAIVDRGHS